MRPNRHTHPPGTPIRTTGTYAPLPDRSGTIVDWFNADIVRIQLTDGETLYFYVSDLDITSSTPTSHERW